MHSGRDDLTPEAYGPRARGTPLVPTTHESVPASTVVRPPAPHAPNTRHGRVRSVATQCERQFIVRCTYLRSPAALARGWCAPS